MSTTSELIDIIVELKMQLIRKNEIIHNLQDYIHKNTVNQNENMIDIKEYDRLYEEFNLLKEELEFYVNSRQSGAVGANHKWGGVDFEYDTGRVIPRDDSHNWG